MKLLSVALMNHDTNFSYHDSNQLFYHKLERTKRQKRFVLFPVSTWRDEVSNIWDIDLNKIDDFIFQFDPTTIIPKELSVHIKNVLVQPLHEEICKYFGVKRGWFINHHYCHSLSTWMIETQTPDVSIVIDGLGDGRPWTVFKDNKIIEYGDITKGSIGWEIRDLGKLLGIKAVHQNDIAGKVMGLQSYGILDKNYLNILSQYTLNNPKKLYDPQTWLDYNQDDLLSKYKVLDWVHTVHHRTGECLVDFFKKYANPNDVISYSGGVAQNVIWNSVLKKHFKNMVIPPHASDEGISLGAIEWLRKKHNLQRFVFTCFPFGQTDVHPGKTPSHGTIETAANLLSQGKIVGWYQGNGEIGPRALGNRSILMDPRLKDGKYKINKVKKRENYRPFGASVLDKMFTEHFEGETDEFMLYTSYVKSDEFPAITHVDNTCRVQSVNYKNEYFYKLLNRFYDKTNCPVLLNTSLNLAGKPIAAYPHDALELFYTSNIDAMIIGDFVYQK